MTDDTITTPGNTSSTPEPFGVQIGRSVEADIQRLETLVDSIARRAVTDAMAVEAEVKAAAALVISHLRMGL